MNPLHKNFNKDLHPENSSAKLALSYENLSIKNSSKKDINILSER